MIKKILVVYLYTSFDDIRSFSNFIKNYKKFKSGQIHKLLVCYKLLNKRKIFICRNKLIIKKMTLIMVRTEELPIYIKILLFFL